MSKLAPFVLLFSLLASNLTAKDLSPNNGNHSLGLGVLLANSYGSLKGLHGPGYGLLGSYRYKFTKFNSLYANIGFELAYYQSYKEEFLNRHILIAPQARLVWVNTPQISNALILGWEGEYWTNALAKYRSNLLHDDSLFGLQLGYAFIFNISETLSSDLSFIYHLQEFSSKSTYGTAALQLVWRL